VFLAVADFRIDQCHRPMASGRLLFADRAVSSRSRLLFRERFFSHPSLKQTGAIDGVSAFAGWRVLVIGLDVSDWGLPLSQDAGRLLALTLAAAFAINSRFQIAAYMITGGRGHERRGVAWSIVRGKSRQYCAFTWLPCQLASPIRCCCFIRLPISIPIVPDANS